MNDRDPEICWGKKRAEPPGSGGEASISRRHTLNIGLNKAIDRHKSRAVQSPIML